MKQIQSSIPTMKQIVSVAPPSTARLTCETPMTSRPRSLRLAFLTLAISALLGGLVLAWARAIGEFGATLLLTRPEYPTIPIAIQRFLSQPGGLNFGQAMAMATLLMLLTTLAILIIEKLRLSDTGEF